MPPPHQGRIVHPPLLGAHAVVACFVKFRTRYLNWTGDYVAHCHKVSHEDIGMMINLRVGETTGDLTCPTDPYAPDPAVPYIDSGAPTRCED